MKSTIKLLQQCRERRDNPDEEKILSGSRDQGKFEGREQFILGLRKENSIKSGVS